MSFRLSDRVHIDRPPASVWPYVSQLEGELRWRRPYVTELTPRGDPLEPGSRIEGTTHAFGATETYVNEVTEVEPERRLAWRGVDASGALMGRQGSYELEPEGSGTGFRLTMEYEPRGFLGRLQAPLLAVVLRRVLRRFLRQLKEVTEETPQSA